MSLQTLRCVASRQLTCCGCLFLLALVTSLRRRSGVCSVFLCLRLSCGVFFFSGSQCLRSVKVSRINKLSGVLTRSKYSMLFCCSCKQAPTQRLTSLWSMNVVVVVDRVWLAIRLRVNPDSRSMMIPHRSRKSWLPSKLVISSRCCNLTCVGLICVCCYQGQRAYTRAFKVVNSSTSVAATGNT